MISQQEANLSGAQVDAGKDLTLKSIAGNINITAVKDEVLQDEKTGTSRNWKRTRTDDETVIGSTLQAGGNINIAAANPDITIGNPGSGNITISGSAIVSQNGGINITADNDVTIQEVTEKHESLVQTHKKKSGTFSSKTTDTLDYSIVNEVKGSAISGDSVAISSGKDLAVKGSNIVATNNVTLHADNDVNITSAQETGQEEHYKRVKKSGIFSGGGLGFTIGKQSEKTTLNQQVKDEISSTVGSVSGNVTITAGNKVSSEGSTLASGQNIDITGKEVTIDNTVNTYDSQYKYEFKQSGLTVSFGGGVVDTGLNLAGNIERADEVKDDRLKALYEVKAVKDINTLGKQLDGDLTDGLSINIGIGSTKITSEQNTHVETVNMSNITAGGDVTIKATEGNVTLKATTVNATDITLDAAKEINIESAQNKEQSDSKTSSSSASIGASFGVTGSFGGFTGSASSSKGKESEEIGTYTESVLNASGTAALKSGNDTNIIGSTVKGEKVVADVGGDLNVVSKQDSDTYTSKNQSAGIGFDTKKISGSYNSGKINSNYKSVRDQAGIYAGKQGFNITVGKNTELKGAVIASEATPDKNKISTDTLTYSDIQNKADYEAENSGYNLDTKGSIPITPNPGMPVSGDDSSTTKSAISPGTVEIRSNPNADINGLSRDPSGSLNALEKIFDKKTVQEKQELAKVFGEEAYQAVGDLALREYKKAAADAAKAPINSPEYQDAIARKAAWAPGGSNEVALHVLVGGIMADLGGGSFVSGAAGSGVSESVRGQLQNLSPELQQWGSALIGAAASSVIGGNAQTGASTAVSGVVNNGLMHEQQIKMVSDLSNAIDKARTTGDTQDIVKAVLDWSQVNTTNNRNNPGVGEEADKDADTITMMSVAAQQLGIQFTYNQNDSLTNNFIAFQQAMIPANLNSIPTVDSSTLMNATGVVVIVAGTVAVLYNLNGKWVQAGGSGAVAGKVGEEIASSAAQYQRLKESLAIEEIQSVVSTTAHGATRLIQRGFSSQEISNLKLSPDKIMKQGDGANVFIKNLGDGKYNVIVEGETGVITALKNISEKSLERLANNYKWE